MTYILMSLLAEILAMKIGAFMIDFKIFGRKNSMIIFSIMGHYQKIFIYLIKKMKLKNLNFSKEVMMMKIPMRKKIKSKMQKTQIKNRKPVSTIG